MTVDTETLILKALEKLDQKLDKFIETTNQKFDDVNTSLTSIQVNQARLEGEVKTLDVKFENLQKGQDELKADLITFKAETKENFKEIRNEVSGLYKWVIGLFIPLVIGIGTFIIKAFDLFPKA